MISPKRQESLVDNNKTNTNALLAFLTTPAIREVTQKKGIKAAAATFTNKQLGPKQQDIGLFTLLEAA